MQPETRMAHLPPWLSQYSQTVFLLFPSTCIRPVLQSLYKSAWFLLNSTTSWHTSRWTPPENLRPERFCTAIEFRSNKQVLIVSCMERYRLFRFSVRLIHKLFDNAKPQTSDIKLNFHTNVFAPTGTGWIHWIGPLPLSVRKLTV